jgi:hypothetical protein
LRFAQCAASPPAKSTPKAKGGAYGWSTTARFGRKKWLDSMSKSKGMSMAQIIRNAIDEYRKNHSDDIPTELDSLLMQTKGIWKNKDGLSYQSNIRKEWDKS